MSLNTSKCTLGYKLYHRPDVKCRIAEIQCEVHSRALMGIDEKRDLLRQMIEGTVPTKVNKSKDGTVEAVFDMLGALVVRRRRWRASLTVRQRPRSPR